MRECVSRTKKDAIVAATAVMNLNISISCTEEEWINNILSILRYNNKGCIEAGLHEEKRYWNEWMLWKKKS